MGTVAGANVTTVMIACATKTYTVGGTVAGLAGSGLVLQDNLGDNLSISADGAFTFATPVASSAPYSVTVLTQPSSPTQTCVVASGSGVIADAAVNGVAITCTTNHYKVGGTVVGLDGTGPVLQNGGADDLAITMNGAFQFATSALSGASFAVTIPRRNRPARRRRARSRARPAPSAAPTSRPSPSTAAPTSTSSAALSPASRAAASSSRSTAGRRSPSARAVASLSRRRCRAVRATR